MLRFTRVALAGLVFIAAVTLCSTARANGRFPEAQTFESAPGTDGRTIFLRTTFGVLVSRDRGEHWRWICERALGYEGRWDPPIAVTRDGRLWVGLEGGLLSTIDGCQVERATELDGHTVRDLTTDARGEALWAITGAPGKRSFVWRRAPGKRFEQLGGMDDVNVMTIEVSPSRPSRVYVSGQPYATIRGGIYRSDDGGMTFKDERATSLVADGPLFIGSVDPIDPQRLLVRHLHAKGSELYLSKDGGHTLAKVLSMESAMFGFAKSADGKTIWAGSGLPEHGLFRSTDRGEHFDPVARHGVLCLYDAAPDALFVCENALAPGAPAIGIARDGIGKTIVPVARFADIEGPVACGAGDAGEHAAGLCESSWAEVRMQLSPTPFDGGADPDGGAKKRRRRDAGVTVADAGSPAAAPARSACGCESVGRAAPRGAWSGLALLALAIAAIRRARLDRA